MHTTFLLHGGRLKYADARNDAYFRELTKGLRDGDQVLFVGFARRDKQDRWEVYERERQYIVTQTSADIEVINATYEDFMAQLHAAKVVHITGGESPELVDDMKGYPDFIEALKGKVVGGSSAGACLFSTYYFFSGERGVLEGLGTLPLRLRVHSDNPEFGDIERSLQLLDEYPKELELVQLAECAWVKKIVEL